MNKTPAITTAILLACAACAPVEPNKEAEPEGVGLGEVVAETATRALFGSLSITGDCQPFSWVPRPPADAATLNQKVADAVSYAQSVVSTVGFAKCVEQSMPIDAMGWSSEHIYARSTTPNSVTVSCVDASDYGCGADQGHNWVGCGRIGIDEESFQLDTNYVRTKPIETIAGTMVHEILHNWGADHPSGPTVSHSVPRVAQRCVATGRPEGSKRDEIPGDVAMAPIGGGFQGEYFGGRCYDDEYATGLELQHNGSGVTGLSLLCSQEREGQLSGLRITGGASPPGAGTTYQLLCGPGMLLVGVMGHHGWPAVRALQAVCAPLSSLRSDGTDPVQYTSRVGVTENWAFSRRCPAGKAVMAIRQRGGSTYPGHIELICDDVLAPEAPYFTHVRGTGQPTSSAAREIEGCEGDQFLEGFFGHRTAQGSVRRLGGFCATVRDLYTDGDNTDRAEALGGAPDLEADSEFIYKCTPNEVVVGYRLWTDSRARGIVPLCALPNAWRLSNLSYHPAPGAPTSFPGTMSDALCPQGEAGQGFQVRGESVVNQVDLRCRDLPPARRFLSNTPAVGGNGGTPFYLACPEGGPVTGLGAAENGQALDGLSAWCGYAHGDTVRAQEGYLLAPTGGSRSRLQPIACPAGQVLVGLTGTADNLVQSVRPVCQSIRLVRSGSALLRGTGPAAGDPTLGTTFRLSCPFGQVVGAIRGSSGARIDSLNLSCAAPDLTLGTAVSDVNSVQLLRLPLLEDQPRALRFIMSGRGAATSFDIFVRKGLPPTVTDYDAIGAPAFGSMLQATLPGPVENGVYWVLILPKGSTSGRFIVQ